MFNIVNTLKKYLTSKKMINLYYIFLIGTILLLLSTHFLNSMKESCVENYQCGSPEKKESLSDKKKRCFKESLSISEEKLRESENNYNSLLRATNKLAKDLKKQKDIAAGMSKGNDREKEVTKNPENVKLDPDNPKANL